MSVDSALLVYKNSLPKMTYPICIAIGFIAGLVTGLLVMRKHSANASALEAKGKAALDALKGR